MTGEVVTYSGPGPGGSHDVDQGNNSQSSHYPYQPYIDWEKINFSCAGNISGNRKKNQIKSIEEIQQLVDAKKLNELKNCLRNNQWLPNNNIRARLWQVLSSFHNKDNDTMYLLYWDTVKQIYGTHDIITKTGPLPTFVEPSFQMSYYLNERGIQIARRIVSIISYSCPDITYAPSLFPIACILLHYMTEEECYSCVSWMISSKTIKFITQTKLHFETIWRTSMVLSRKHAKSAISYIAKQAGDNSAIESIHLQWLNCIFRELPFQHLIRVMDCFICEGRKVMYRVWMAILMLFHRHLTSLPANSRSALNKDGALDTELITFCRNIPHSPEKLLKKAYGIRNFRSVEMDRLFVKTEMYLKSKTAAGSSMPVNSSMGTRSRSSDVLPTSHSQNTIQMISHTLAIREGARSPDPRPRSIGMYPLQGIRSMATDFDTLLTLWSWLPVRITMYQPELLYTTEEHGCSMTTFFARVERHEPTIMIVKSTCGDVFGAYCSTNWKERNAKDPHGGRQGYFGTGETFVFTLHPQEVKYPWVGIQAQSSSDGPAVVRHAAELFMASDNHMVTIGGG